MGMLTTQGLGRAKRFDACAAGGAIDREGELAGGGGSPGQAKVKRSTRTVPAHQAQARLDY